MTRPDILPLHRGYVRPSDLAKLTRDAGAAYEGKRVYRELERFNAEHPTLARFVGDPVHETIGDRLPRHICARIIAGTSVALWLAIFAIGYFVAQLLRAVFS